MPEPVIINGDALISLMMMDDCTVHTIVTSPPYYGPRDYGRCRCTLKTRVPDPSCVHCGGTGRIPGMEKQIGLEKTPEEYIQHLVEVFREARRVLRDDGTLWLNLGDSYSGSMSTTGSVINKNSISAGTGQDRSYRDKPLGVVPGYKPKDLMGIPWRVADALLADGWYRRSWIPWIKRNAMPSSVTDRPASSIEHIFLFSKSREYYYDHVATLQPASDSYNRDKRPRNEIRQRVNKNTKYPNEGQYKKQDAAGNITYTGFNDRYIPDGTGLRYMRDSDFFFRTWQGLLHNENGEPMAMVVNPRGYKGAHFACFPVQLVEPMILAGTCEKGVCPKCGAPYRRFYEKKFIPQQDVTDPEKLAKGSVKSLDESNGWGDTPRGTVAIVTIGWEPTCKCGCPESIPATVLDPFAGSSSVGVACNWHNRNFIGIDLNPQYCELGATRLQENK